MVLSYILYLLIALSPSQTADWEFEFEKEGVKVYTKYIEGSSFKAFKGEMVFDVSADKILNQILNIESYPEWCYRTTSVKVLKREPNKVFYYYVSATPPMVKNREAYFYSEILPSASDGEITVKMGMFSPDTPVPSGYIRMPFSDGFWKLKPISAEKTEVVFQMQADPGGIIPAWLANMAATDSPWITMTNLQKIILEKQK